MNEPYLINGSGGAMDRLGVVSAEQVWEVDDEPTCTTHAPTHPLGIPILERQWREQSHGKWFLTLKFEGVTDVSAADGNEDYEGDSGDAEDPIETFPGLDALIQTFPKQPDNGDGRIVWSQNYTGQDGEQHRSPMFGVEGYKVSQPTWTQHKLWAELPSDLYNTVDHIFDAPLVPAGVDPASFIPPNSDKPDWPPRNWLLARVVPRKRGNVWQVSKTWILSGPGGWNIYLYSHA